MDLETSAFRDQMQLLKSHYRLIGFDQALSEMASDAPLRPGVAITFDDGTSDWVENVAPILNELDVPALFYIATDFIERGIEFPHGGTPLSWSGVTELASVPQVSIGSHTHTHKLLDRLEPSEIDMELDASIELLAEHVGYAPRHFAYPKAVPPSSAAHAAVSKRFDSAVLAGTKPNVGGSDPYRLSRSPIQPSDDPKFFEAKASGGLGLEDSIRRTANRIRYRGASS